MRCAPAHRVPPAVRGLRHRRRSPLSHPRSNVLAAQLDADPSVGSAGPIFDFNQHFELGPDESLETVPDVDGRVAHQTERVVAGVDDLGQPAPVAPGVPWFPADVEAWSVRRERLHLMQQTARHAGIVRESVDGATAFALMAAADSGPATAWMRPGKSPGRRERAADAKEPPSAGAPAALRNSGLPQITRTF